MVYNYLLDLYKMLEERKKELGGEKSLSSDSNEYQRGQLAAIREFTSFLKDNYHEKLPRRMR
jgi:hypothetical protein